MCFNLFSVYDKIKGLNFVKKSKNLELQSPLRYRVLFVPAKCFGEFLSPHLALQLTFSKNGNDKTRKIKYRILSL